MLKASKQPVVFRHQANQMLSSSFDLKGFTQLRLFKRVKERLAEGAKGKARGKKRVKKKAGGKVKAEVLIDFYSTARHPHRGRSAATAWP